EASAEARREGAPPARGVERAAGHAGQPRPARRRLRGGRAPGEHLRRDGGRRPMSKNDDRDTRTPDGAPIEAQPKWRRDFPIDWDEDEYVSRRDLVKFMALTSCAFVGGHAWLIARASREEGPAELAPAAIARTDELAVGGAKVFEFPEGSPPRLLVRLE